MNNSQIGSNEKESSKSFSISKAHRRNIPSINRVQ